MPNLTKKQLQRSSVVWRSWDLHLQSHNIKNTRNVLEIAHLCEFGHKSSRIMPILASDLGEESPYLEDSKYALNASIRSLQPKIFMKTFYVPDNNVELCQIWAKMASSTGRFFSVSCPLSNNIWFLGSWANATAALGLYMTSGFFVIQEKNRGKKSGTMIRKWRFFLECSRILVFCCQFSVRWTFLTQIW